MNWCTNYDQRLVLAVEGRSISICSGARYKSLARVMAKSRVARGRGEPLWVARPCGFLVRIFFADFGVRIVVCGSFGADILVQIFWCRFFCADVCADFDADFLEDSFDSETAGRATKNPSKKSFKKSPPKSSPNPPTPRMFANQSSLGLKRSWGAPLDALA